MKIIFSILLLTTFVSCENKISGVEDEIVNVEPIIDCSLNDTNPPILNGEIKLQENSSVFNTPAFSFNQAKDNCELSHYEVSLGTNSSNSDIVALTNIGNQTNYQLRGLNLKYDEVYYISIQAVDTVGNKSARLVSSPFQIFTPKSLTNLVVWLDASNLNSLEDNSNNNGNSPNFSGDIKIWKDLSESSAVHNFQKEGSFFPNFDVVERGVSFNGTQEFMATFDHVDINLATVAQRTIALNFKTSDNITSRQVLFEEGGTVRGMNIYIENNQLVCGFWNERNDGDGVQPYMDVRSYISTNTKYTVFYRFDYSHFSDASSSDGTIECIINDLSTGTKNTTSRLHPHSGDIGLGAMNDGSYFSDGDQSREKYFFDGIIYELLIYNTAHSDKELEKLYNVLSTKW